MVRSLLLILGAIPVLGAVLIMYPLLTGESTFSSPIDNSVGNQPSSTSPIGSSDSLRIEYSKQYLRQSASSPIEQVNRLQAYRTETLLVEKDGSIEYTATENGVIQAQESGQISPQKFKKIKAIIKETGFTNIEGSFPVKDKANNYTKYTISLQLNNKKTRINWPEQKASEKIVPPIVVEVQKQLDSVIKGIIN